MKKKPTLKSLNYPNLIAIIGSYGSGKSLHLMELSICLAERHKRALCYSDNMDTNAIQIRKWAALNNCPWVAKCAKITTFSHRNAHEIIGMTDTVIVVDEAGITLNARNWQKVGQDLLGYLFQIRHYNSQILLAFHYLEQIDKAFRETCECFLLCRGATVPAPTPPHRRMISRGIFRFNQTKFRRIAENPQALDNLFKLWTSAVSVRWEVLPVGWAGNRLQNLIAYVRLIPKLLENRRELQRMGARRRFIARPWNTGLLFKCYDSFSQPDRRPTRRRIILHKPYTVELLEEFDRQLAEGQYQEYTPEVPYLLEKLELNSDRHRAA